MQMFGIGLPELMMVLVLAVLVVGPDRLPAFAADLARWIRRARVYANHVTKDFNEVISELEKEVGTTRDDWKEIASVVGIHANSVRTELEGVSSQLNQLNAELADPKPAAADNVVSIESGREPAVPVEGENTPLAEKPWYEPETTPRRRSRE